MDRARQQLSRYGWRPVEPPRRPVLFVNPRSGGGKAASGGVAERARANGIEVVILSPGQDLAALAREAVTGGAVLMRKVASTLYVIIFPERCGEPSWRC